MCIVYAGGGIIGSGSSQDPRGNQIQGERLGVLPIHWDFRGGMSSSLEGNPLSPELWTEAVPGMHDLQGNPDEPHEVIIDEPDTIITVEPTPAPAEAPRIEVRELGTYSTSSEAQWRDGYRDANGVPEWEDILWCVITKEAGTWIGWYGQNGYWSRAQFSDGDTWPKVERYLISIGVTPNPDEPYIIGLAVAWWAKQISHPSHLSGWAGTWKLCTQ